MRLVSLQIPAAQDDLVHREAGTHLKQYLVDDAEYFLQEVKARTLRAGWPPDLDLYLVTSELHQRL